MEKVFGAFIVLIDTWWNVNFKAVEAMLPNFSVLIDTWWNVNHPDTLPA